MNMEFDQLPRIVPFLREMRGATAIEYGLVAAGVAVAIAAAIFYLGGDIDRLFQNTQGAISENSSFGDGPSVLLGVVIAETGFENVDGFARAVWGYRGPEETDIEGWINEGGHAPEYVFAGRYGIESTGSYMLDMDANKENMSLSKEINGLDDGSPIRLTFSAANRRSGNGVAVYWGGELVNTFVPDGPEMKSYSIDLVGGFGDGSNKLTVKGTGPEDSIGALLDDLRVTR